MTDNPPNERPTARTGGTDVTLLIARTVEPGYERTFEMWARGILDAAAGRWKMAISAGVGLYPISLVGAGVLGPRLSGLPLAARTAVFAALFSVLMTYLAMPVVSRVLRRWLLPTGPTPSSTTRVEMS
jgi:antibiotic biosynthesis monooxygenase (ABM) superfamily enzyme